MKNTEDNIFSFLKQIINVRKLNKSAIIDFKSNKVPKIKRLISLNWIINVWYDSKKITCGIIKNSFLYFGMSNILTGEEDDLFIG